MQVNTGIPTAFGRRTEPELHEIAVYERLFRKISRFGSLETANFVKWYASRRSQLEICCNGDPFC